MHRRKRVSTIRNIEYSQQIDKTPKNANTVNFLQNFLRQAQAIIYIYDLIISNKIGDSRSFSVARIDPCDTKRKIPLESRSTNYDTVGCDYKLISFFFVQKYYCDNTCLTNNYERANAISFVQHVFEYALIKSFYFFLKKKILFN